MMRGKAVEPRCAVVLCAILLVCQVARAGPLAGEAQARVDQAVALMPQDLGAAEAMLKSVEADYPGELEAIGWAHYRLSEIYWAGERWFDAAAAVRWSWDRIQEGVLTDEDQKFWCGNQYARCLNRLTLGPLLAQVCSQTLDVYSGFPEPDSGKQNAAGWLHYYLAQCEYAAGEFAVAEAEAHLAWEDGKAVQNGSLASWGRLLEARAAMAGRNLLLAEGVLNDCLNDYAPHMSEDYAGEVRVRLSQCQVMTGRFSEAHDAVIELFNNPEADEGLQAEALVRLGESAMAESATPEAVRALALATNALGDIPTWGDIARARWNSLLDGQDQFALLLDASGGGSGPERAAVELELARREGNRDNALSRCDAAEVYSSDPRLGREIDLVRGLKSGEDVLSTYENLLAQANGSRPLVKRVLDKVRPKTWDRPGEESYAGWLDAHQAELPREAYLLEKAWWLRDKGQDSEAALPLLDEVLSSCGSTSDRIDALHGRVVALYRLERDQEAAAAVEALEREICDPSERERALLIAADSIYRQREAPAVELFDRIIASGHDPIWLREAYLIKAQCLWNYHHGPEAVDLLDELWALGPLEAAGGRLAGEGMLLQATILYPHRGNAERAEQIYEIVISASDLFSAVQERAYLNYVRMLEQQKVEPSRIIELCDQGLEALSDPDPYTPGMLSLSKAKALYALGETDEAIAIAEELLRENPNGDVKKASRQFLGEVGQ